LVDYQGSSSDIMKALKNQIKSNELNQNPTVEDMIILIQYLAKLSYKDRVDFFKTQNGPIYLFSTWKAIYTASKDLRSMCFGLFVANFLPVLTDKQFFSLSINYVNKVSKIHQCSDQQKLPQNFGIEISEMVLKHQIVFGENSDQISNCKFYQEMPFECLFISYLLQICTRESQTKALVKNTNIMDLLDSILVSVQLKFQVNGSKSKTNLKFLQPLIKLIEIISLHALSMLNTKIVQDLTHIFENFIECAVNENQLTDLNVNFLSSLLNLFINLTGVNSKSENFINSATLTDIIFKTLILSSEKLLFNTKADIDQKCLAIVVNILVSNNSEYYQALLLPVIREHTLDGLTMFTDRFLSTFQKFEDQSNLLNSKNTLLASSKMLMHKKLNLEKEIEVKTREQLCLFLTLCYLSVIITSLAYHKSHLIGRIKICLDEDKLSSMEGFLCLFKATLKDKAHDSKIELLLLFFKENFY